MLWLLTSLVCLVLGINTRVGTERMSSECRDAGYELGREFRDAIQKPNITFKEVTKLRYFQLYDSWGKPPSGILEGHLKWLGSPEECYEIGDMKHCVVPATSKSLKKEIMYGICLPQVCNKDDIHEIAMQYSQGVLDEELVINGSQASRISCETPISTCKRAMEKLIATPFDLTRHTLTDMLRSHIKVLDSWGRPAAGFARGNINWIGSREECVSVEGTKYCMAEMNVKLFYKMGSYGICVAKECNRAVVEEILNLGKEGIFSKSGPYFSRFSKDITFSRVTCY